MALRKYSMQELNRLTADAFQQTAKLPLVLVLDNVRSLLNVGSIFRTADAFRVEKIWLTGLTGTPPHREIEKTALGSTESVAWAYATDSAACVQQLKAEGYMIVALEQVQGGVALQSFVYQGKPTVLVLGNEIRGVDDAVLALCDLAFEIPQYGTKHSLNVAVAAGIAVHHLACQYFSGI